MTYSTVGHIENFTFRPVESVAHRGKEKESVAMLLQGLKIIGEKLLALSPITQLQLPRCVQRENGNH